MIRKICNIGYFLPAVLGLLFYGAISLSGGVLVYMGTQYTG